ncbi:MAG: FMN-binding protein [Candidatus Brocadia sp. AMX2]|uniref:Na+-transporting NADH:ubiquinone oxidoreductase subunit C n=1 Tax=Candidatus Brocadia sinica JPN1 TaxID=1197129 RepID=A0ABQ0JYV9_9BACT|nr:MULTISPECIES: FMN-binding protein [Brocadia]MBC6932365.1 FMN-binding protein [Candidatus Brocadia sp.]MBL1169819.1 FMN-binding protein [Candidatus Brocadia sp. AMX1]MCK6469324.1 FMN-binding protein [Candidatus Brocadia sinica]NOG40264.1 FMN-binding protein [Planctomycetota bacterium]KAA0243736.1 MAG: FMN-binding protein [Candidatus Brocadia sp. AMX2]
MEELKKIILRIVSILLITFLPCGGLLMVYFYTSPKIAEYYDVKEKRAVLDIFKIPYRAKENNILGFHFKSYDKKDIKEVFGKNITIEEPTSVSWNVQRAGTQTVKEKPNGGKRIFKYVKDGNLQGVGFVESRMGYGYNKSSIMSLFICVEPDLETLKGIEVLDHSETPGLGGRLTEDQFKKQFIGKKLRPRILVVKGRKAAGANEVDAITGATNTSKGIESFLNDAMKEFWEGQGDIKW